MERNLVLNEDSFLQKLIAFALSPYTITTTYLQILSSRVEC